MKPYIREKEKSVDSCVIDTNVLVVANGHHPPADIHQVFKCQQFLIKVQKKHISIDSLGEILGEYFSHCQRSGQPGIGDAFARWLWDNQGNSSRCERVDITSDPTGEREFLEFPKDEDLKGFDRSDQKFAAVAISSRFDATIYNASDSDWWEYRAAFERVGVKIEFLCPELIKNR